jgi:hypothetical protein
MAGQIDTHACVFSSSIEQRAAECLCRDNLAGSHARRYGAQIQNVIDRLVELGFNVHRSTGVMHTVLGGVGGEEFGIATSEVMEGEGSAPHRLAL